MAAVPPASTNPAPIGPTAGAPGAEISQPGQQPLLVLDGGAAGGSAGMVFAGSQPAATTSPTLNNQPSLFAPATQGTPMPTGAVATTITEVPATQAPVVAQLTSKNLAAAANPVSQQQQQQQAPLLPPLEGINTPAPAPQQQQVPVVFPQGIPAVPPAQAQTTATNNSSEMDSFRRAMASVQKWVNSVQPMTEDDAVLQEALESRSEAATASTQAVTVTAADRGVVGAGVYGAGTKEGGSTDATAVLVNNTVSGLVDNNSNKQTPKPEARDESPADPAAAITAQPQLQGIAIPRQQVPLQQPIPAQPAPNLVPGIAPHQVVPTQQMAPPQQPRVAQHTVQYPAQTTFVQNQPTTQIATQAPQYVQAPHGQQIQTQYTYATAPNGQQFVTQQATTQVCYVQTVQPDGSVQYVPVQAQASQPQFQAAYPQQVHPGGAQATQVVYGAAPAQQQMQYAAAPAYGTPQGGYVTYVQQQ